MLETVFNQSIWGDEGFSAILSMKSIPEIIKIISRDTSPPLWNIFEHFAFRFFGTQEIVIRGLSLSFFLLAVFFTYKIAAYLYNKKTGLFAALLTLFNPFFFTYAFEGRMYSILALGVTASMYYFLRYFNDEEVGQSTKFGYVLFSLWALYSHHFSFFAFLVQGVWFLYELALGKRKRAKKMIKLFIFIGLGYLPWLIPLYNQTKMVGGGFWLGTPTTKDLSNMFTDYLAKGIKSPLKIPVLDIEVIDVALLLVIIMLVVRNWFRGIKKSIFFLMWFLLPIVATWVISQKFQSIFFNRYLLYTIPGAMLLLASNKRGVASYILIILTLLTFASIDYQYFTHPAKLPFREMANFVKETQKEGDYLINWYTNGTHHIWETKYYGIPAPIYAPGEGELPFFVGTALMEKGDIIREIPEEVKRIGIVTSGAISEVSLPGFEQDEFKDFNGLKFIWYSKFNAY